jgi:hypothetical protein
MSGRTIVAFLAIAIGAHASPSGQQAPRDAAAAPTAVGTAVISGRVIVDENDGGPVRRTRVSLTSSDRRENSRAILTDDEGRFAFTGLPSGRYSINAAKPGWVTTYYGSSRPGRAPGTPLAIADGQREDLVIKLARGAVIAGRITDEHGRPQSGARPMVLEMRTVAGRKTLSQVFVPALGLTQTDDRGEYRVYGLPPGTYVVGASVSVGATTGFATVSADEVTWALSQRAAGGGRGGVPIMPGARVTYAPVYYPGTVDPAAAVTIALTAGEERTGVDLVMRPVPVARVQGTIRRADGGRLQVPQIVLTPAGEDVVVSSIGQTTYRPSLEPGGRFTFAAVRPGRYVLTVRSASAPPGPRPRPAPGEPVRLPAPALDLWATADVTVQGDDVSGLDLVLEPGATLTGRIAFEASTLEPPSDLSRVRLQLSAPEMTMGPLTGRNMYLGSAMPDSTFSLVGITPGRYLLMAFMPVSSPAGPQWMVKSISAGGQDILDRPLEIRGGQQPPAITVTITDRVTEISGVLQDALGRPAPEYRVFVFPVDRAYWTAMSTRLRPPARPSSDGQYRIQGLPPGEYFVAALTDSDEIDYLDATFLEQVAGAAFKITLKEGEKKQQDLRLQGRYRP